MNETFINLTPDNLDTEHICCAISDKKHQIGVSIKKQWLKQRIKEGHVFRKLDQKGKVFIEYVPIETAWAPVSGENYLYIYCLWVSGSFKGKGYAKSLLEYCIHDAKETGKSGVCVLSSKKKKPCFSESAKKMTIDQKELTIYYGLQCPYIPNCIEQVQEYCNKNNIPLNLIAVDTLETAKNLPCVFNNWAVFYNGDFVTNHLLNETFLKKKCQL